MVPGNLFSHLPAALPEELLDTLLQRDGLRLERIVSRGHATPPGEWYDQEWDEWVCLLSGSATLLFDNDVTLQLSAGDHLLIPAHRRTGSRPPPVRKQVSGWRCT